MAIRIDSEASCRAAYIDYHTNKNSKVTESDMRKIVQRYDEDKRKAWQRAYEASTGDVNKYDFDDDEFEEIRLESYENTEETYGEDVNIGAEKARNIGDGVATGIGVASTAGIGLLKGGSKLMDKIFGGGMLFKEGGKTGLIGYILSGISCAMAFAVGLHAKLNKANEEEVNAVNDLKGEMENQQEVIKDEAENLKEIQNDIEKASNNATEENEAANNDIKTRAATHTSYTNTYNTLQAKIDRGVQLSASETQLYNGVVKLMKTSSADIQTRSEKASDVLEKNKATITNYQADFDGIATNIANVQGVTDYAAEIDEATAKSCKTQATIQKISSISAYTAAGGMAIATATFATQVALPPVMIAVIAVGALLTGLAVLGGVWSGKAAQEQEQFAQQANEEVSMRIDTQESNTNLNDNFEEGVNIYNTSKAAIDASTIDRPNNLTSPQTRTNLFVNNTPQNKSGEDDNGNGKPKYLT